MFYYKPIDIPDFEIIRQKVYDLFPKNFNRTNLFYPENNLEPFLEIKELTSFLENSNLLRQVYMFAFNVVTYGYPEIIHVDTGEFNYSLNLPILNCENTFIKFYETSIEPRIVNYITSTKSSATYLGFYKKDCQLVKSLEMTKPHIINVKIPHGIANPNKATRITLLIRLIKYEY